MENTGAKVPEVQVKVADEDKVDRFQVKFDLFDFSPAGTQRFPNLYVSVHERREDGTFDNYSGGTMFTLKWHGRGSAHLPEVGLHEIQFQDELNGDAIAGNSKQLLAIKTKHFAAGGFGEIYHGVTNRGMRVVVKKWKGRVTPEAIAGAYFEAFMSVNFRHRNILGLLNIVRKVNEPPWLVYRHMKHGCLADVLQNTELLSTQKAKLKVTKDVANGMLYLHCQRCIHRDLTLKNILIDEEVETEGIETQIVARLTDFGLSMFLDGSGSSLVMLPRGRESDVRRLAYSLFYTAPEVLPVYEKTVRRMSMPNIPWNELFPSGQENCGAGEENSEDLESKPEHESEFLTLEPQGAYHFKSDVWSFGVVAHQIWTEAAYEPFTNTDYFDISVADVRRMLSEYNFVNIYTPNHNQSCSTDKHKHKHDRLRLLAAVNKAFGGPPRAHRPDESSSSKNSELKAALKKKLEELFQPGADLASSATFPFADLLEQKFSRIVEEVFGKNPSPNLLAIQEVARLISDQRTKKRIKSPADFVPVKDERMSVLIRKMFHGNPKRRPAFPEIIKRLERQSQGQCS